MYDLSARIKKALEKRGLSQRELTEKINMSASEISNYEPYVQAPL